MHNILISQLNSTETALDKTVDDMLRVLTLWRPLLSYGYSYKASLPDRVKPSFVILISGHSDAQPWASPECPDDKYYKWRLNPDALYSCTHMASVVSKD